MKKSKSYRLVKAINDLFDKRVEHPSIKKYGSYSKIRTVIREEPISWRSNLRGREREIQTSVPVRGGQS